MSLNSIPEIVEDIRAGKMVILLDDEDRENEGDLIMAAECVSAEHINFMTKFGRGLICMPLSKERSEKLQLPLMASKNGSKHGTAFTVSIEARDGITTGISAADRARTIQVAVDKNTTAEEIVQPGHVFPLIAQSGGVLRRAGHTEAAVDLAKMAGYEPAAVIVEILKEDGSMARRPDLEEIAKEHGLKIGTVADLIEYRLTHEQSVKQVYQRDIKTDFGQFALHAFKDEVDGGLHIALVHGDISAEQSVPVRVHLRRTLSDVLGETGGRARWTIRNVQEYIQKQPCGVLLLLREDESDHTLLASLSEDEQKVEKNVTAPANGKMDLRKYGLGAQILRSLGVRKMTVLSSPLNLHAISGFGLEVDGYIGADGSKVSTK